MKRDPNRPRRREPYHYDAEASVYLASILAILQRGQSIPVRGRWFTVCCCRMGRVEA